MSGCWQAWRTGQLCCGVGAGLITAALGGALSSPGMVLCLAVWHDAATWRAIEGSGGTDEALDGVPLMLVFVGNDRWHHRRTDRPSASAALDPTER